MNYSHLSKTLMRLWSQEQDPTKVLPRKSQGIEIIHKRSTIVHQPYLFYARLFNNRTSTIFILCKTSQQPMMEQKLQNCGSHHIVKKSPTKQQKLTISQNDCCKQSGTGQQAANQIYYFIGEKARPSLSNHCDRTNPKTLVPHRTNFKKQN